MLQVLFSEYVHARVGICTRLININRSRAVPAIANGARQMYGKSTGIKYRLAFSGLSRTHDYVLSYLSCKHSSGNDA